MPGVCQCPSLLTTSFNVLANQWWALDKELTIEDVKINGLTMMIESAELGVTSIIDHHAGPNSVEGSLCPRRSCKRGHEGFSIP